MKLHFAVLAAVMAVAPAQAIEPKNAAYYCTNEATGGVKYSPQLQKWTSGSFLPDKPFVIRLEFLNSRRQKQFDWTELSTVNSFSVTVTEAGSKDAHACKDASNYKAPVEVWDDGWLRCNVALSELRFNPENNRYMSAYLVGYVGGDNGGDTPAISIGTCTKVN